MATSFADAIVLSRAPLGDVDWSLTLYTLQQGKLNARLRGARKTLSKLAGSLEPFCIGNVAFAHGMGGLTVIGADMRPLADEARKSVRAVATASVASEFVAHLVEERHRDIRQYRLIADFISAVEQSAALPLRLTLARLWFLWNALELHGTGFELASCVICRKRPEAGKLFFSYAHGGIVSGHCKSRTPDAEPISANAVKLLRLVRGMSVGDLSRVHGSRTTLAGAARAADGAYTFISESESLVLSALRAPSLA